MKRGLPFELLIGLRYLRSKGGRGFLSLLTVIAMAGMAIGVMALIVVLAVMTASRTSCGARSWGRPRTSW